MTRRFILAGVFFICISSVVFGFGSKEKESKTETAPALPTAGNVTLNGNSGRAVPPAVKSGSIIRVTGTVRLVGNANFPEIVISTPEESWYISSEEMNLLQNLQHQMVTVEGTAYVREIVFASGLSGGYRYTLQNIKIIQSP